MKNVILILSTFILLTACATTPQVELLVDNFQGKDKEFVLLSNNLHLRRLRVELRKKGFKVKKFALHSDEILTKKTKTEDGEIIHTVLGNRATAKYGIDVTDVEVIDRCIGNNSKKINITLEITDLDTNDVVAYVTNGGWDGPCIIYSGNLYRKIAKQINGIWKNQYSAIEVKEDYDDYDDYNDFLQ